MGFKEVRMKVIEDLVTGNWAYEARADIDEKNLLAIGKVTPADVIALVTGCRGNEYSSSPHHQDASLMVHVFKVRGWYVKFYFLPDTMFISVHE